MPKTRWPYLHRIANRHGTLKWQVRLPGGSRKRVTLQSEFGTPEFKAEYEAAFRTEPKPVSGRIAPPGSLSWLVDRYRASMAWSELSPATRRQRENILRGVLDTAGAEPFKAIGKAEIVAGKDRRRDRPAAARHFVDAMRGLFRWAVEAGIAKADPTLGVKVRQTAGEGHHTWTEEEVLRFEHRWPRGTRERVAFDVLLYTGLRRGDAVTVGDHMVTDGILRVVTEKTGEVVEIPLLAPLVETLEAGPVGSATWIAGDRGRPMKKESFGTWFRIACNAAGVPGSAHGLRKAGATRAAENGATESQLEAIFGWRGGRMASLYTRKARRSRLAKAGASALIKRANGLTDSEVRPIEKGKSNG